MQNNFNSSFFFSLHIGEWTIFLNCLFFSNSVIEVYFKMHTPHRLARTIHGYREQVCKTTLFACLIPHWTKMYCNSAEMLDLTKQQIFKPSYYSDKQHCLSKLYSQLCMNYLGFISSNVLYFYTPLANHLTCCTVQFRTWLFHAVCVCTHTSSCAIHFVQVWCKECLISVRQDGFTHTVRERHYATLAREALYCTQMLSPHQNAVTSRELYTRIVPTVLAGIEWLGHHFVVITQDWWDSDLVCFKVFTVTTVERSR